MAFQQELEECGFILVPGEIMKSLMMSFGATMEDLTMMEKGYVHENLPRVGLYFKNKYSSVLVLSSNPYKV